MKQTWAEFEEEAIRCLHALHRDQLARCQRPRGAAFATLDELQACRDAAVCAYLPGYWGYDFAAGPSRTEPAARYWAVARPSDGRGYHFFVNHEGRVHAASAAFTVDEETCDVPAGLEPMA